MGKDLWKGCEPLAVLEYFQEISAIPRSSSNEKEIADYLEGFAHKHNLSCYRDALHNVVIKKAGSTGCEHLPAVMLQGHTDMVCEKNAGTVHDFSKDPIELEVTDGWLHAKGTTLGADNGIAVAMMLALLSDDSLRHPPLECVFTVQEETGLTGASELDGSVLDARMMINLDSEEEGVATVSCAGGMRVRLFKAVEWTDASGTFPMEISIRGLLGGHSGADIHLEHGNANKLMSRMLYAVQQAVSTRLCSIRGGNKDNAIARESDCVLTFETASDRDRAQKIAETLGAEIRAEFTAAEPDVQITVRPVDGCARCMSSHNTQELTRLLYLAPDGMRKRNVQKGGFVVCSVNLGVVATGDEEVMVCFSPRSSVDSLQRDTRQELELLAELFGCRVAVDGEYPGWSYAEVSRVRDVFCETYRELFHSELRIEAIHAGLECGLFSGKLPGLDAIAVGPTMRGVHTPDESLDLASCERFWRLLTHVLENLSK